MEKSIPYGVRKRWYLRHLRFWNDYLTRHRINLYVSAWIPHEVPDFIIHELCRLKSIPVIYFGLTAVRDTSCIEHDWRESSLTLRDRYEELLAAHDPNQNPDEIPLEERFETRYRALAGPRGEIPPLEVGFVNVTHWLLVRRLFTSNPLAFIGRGLAYLTPAGIRRAMTTFQRSRAYARGQAIYDAHITEPDFTRPYVYMPLSFQPEATTVPGAGVYAELILMAQMLGATLPPDVLIYVKEHPRPSSLVKRDEDFYRDFAAIPSVRFMPRSANTFQLREHSRAIATAAGTAGFEGPLRGKPVFLFAHTTYQYERGVYHIRTAEDCRNAVREIFTEGKTPTLLQCRLYLKAMEETAVHGVLDPYYYDVTHLTEEQNAKNCCTAIVRELDRFFTHA